MLKVLYQNFNYKILKLCNYIYIYKLPSEITGWPEVSTFVKVIYIIKIYYKRNFNLDLFEGN